MVFVKILVLIAAVFTCLGMIKYREKLVRIVGKADWAERYLGNGGTYTMWILWGILLVVIAVVWLMM